MVQLRKSAVQTKAREQARKHGAEITRRHENLTTLAEEFHAAQIEADMILENSQKKADQVLAEGRTEAASATKQAASKAQEMLDTGEPARTVAQRLGVTAAALRRMMSPKESEKETTTEPAPATEPTTSSPASGDAA